MARARNIKPGFFKNYDLADQGPTVQLLFAGLWCLADKAGRLEDKPRFIKAELFPYYDCDVNGELTKLERLGFVRRYVSSGVAVVEIINFAKHQSPHHTEKESALPAWDGVSPCIEKAPVIHGEVTVNSRKLDGGNPPDSLIPDSLIPDSLIKTLSGKPDAPRPNPNKELRASAEQVLAFLNEKAKRNYKPVDANIDPLMARFKEGFSPTVARQVVAKKVREWGTDEKMEQYLRPATLFNKTNFANYAGEIVP